MMMSIPASMSRPVRARVVRVRSDIWRRHDFFWMLHIMDYDTRDDFNSLLLIFAASLALFMSLSGVLLCFLCFSKKDFAGSEERHDLARRTF